MEKQRTKPELLKSLEGTNMPETELIRKVPAASETARNALQSSLPLILSLYDFILGLILDFDRRIRRYGLVKGYSQQ